MKAAAAGEPTRARVRGVAAARSGCCAAGPVVAFEIGGAAPLPSPRAVVAGPRDGHALAVRASESAGAVGAAGADGLAGKSRGVAAESLATTAADLSDVDGAGLIRIAGQARILGLPLTVLLSAAGRRAVRCTGGSQRSPWSGCHGLDEGIGLVARGAASAGAVATRPPSRGLALPIGAVAAGIAEIRGAHRDGSIGAAYLSRWDRQCLLLGDAPEARAGARGGGLEDAALARAYGGGRRAFAVWVDARFGKSAVPGPRHGALVAALAGPVVARAVTAHPIGAEAARTLAGIRAETAQVTPGPRIRPRISTCIHPRIRACVSGALRSHAVASVAGVRGAAVGVILALARERFIAGHGKQRRSYQQVPSHRLTSRCAVFHRRRRAALQRSSAALNCPILGCRSAIVTR